MQLHVMLCTEIIQFDEKIRNMCLKSVLLTDFIRCIYVFF